METKDGYTYIDAIIDDKNRQFSDFGLEAIPDGKYTSISIENKIDENIAEKLNKDPNSVTASDFKNMVYGKSIKLAVFMIR